MDSNLWVNNSGLVTIQTISRMILGGGDRTSSFDFIVLLSSKTKVMGDHVNSKPSSVLGGIIVGLMEIVALATIYSIIF